MSAADGASSGAAADPSKPESSSSSAAVDTSGRIIFIRGPPGSGKSTITQMVLAAMRARGNRVVHLDMDYFRLNIPGPVKGGGSGVVASAMLGASARAALACGFDVVMDGLLSKKTFGSMIQDLCDELGRERVAIFHLDVSLDEAQKRHAGREKSADFDAATLASWFSSGAALGHPWEVSIPQGTTLDAAVATVAAAASAPPASTT